MKMTAIGTRGIILCSLECGHPTICPRSTPEFGIVDNIFLKVDKKQTQGKLKKELIRPPVLKETMWIL
jgi:hypothetical protein